MLGWPFADDADKRLPTLALSLSPLSPPPPPLSLFNNPNNTHTHTHTHTPPSALYQIAHLGDDDEEPEFSSAMPLEEGETFFFAPRPLKNLVQVDEMESLSPIMTSHVKTV